MARGTSLSVFLVNAARKGRRKGSREKVKKKMKKMKVDITGRVKGFNFYIILLLNS